MQAIHHLRWQTPHISMRKQKQHRSQNTPGLFNMKNGVSISDTAGHRQLLKLLRLLWLGLNDAHYCGQQASQPARYLV
jgi:hypothetical protein